MFVAAVFCALGMVLAAGLAPAHEAPSALPLQKWLTPACSSPQHLQAAALVGLVPEMKLEVYSLKRQEKNFAGLAGSVKDVFLKHADAQVWGGLRGMCESCELGGVWSASTAGAGRLSVRNMPPWFEL